MNFKSFAFTSLVLLGFSRAVLAQADVKEGLRLLDVEKYKAAGEYFQAKVSAAPTNALYQYLAGYAAMGGGLYPQALDCFNKGINLDPANPVNYAGLAWYNSVIGNESSCRQNQDKVMTLLEKVKDLDVLMHTARALNNVESYKNTGLAASVINKAITIDKKNSNAELRVVLGDINLETGEGGQAVRAFDAAVEIDKNSAKPYWRLGVLYTRARNPREAMPNFEKAVQLDSMFAPVYRDMGDLYFQLNKNDKAIASYEKYLSMIDKNTESQIKYCSFLINGKYYSQAYSEAKKLEKEDHNNVYVYRMLGYSACEIDSVTDGLSAMENFFAKVNPAKLRLPDYEYYGKLLIKKGKDEEGRAKFAKAIEMDSSRATDIYGFMAEFYMRTKNYEQAARSIEELLPRKKGSLANDYFNLGRAYYSLKQYGKADTAFSKLLEASPTYIPGYTFRARCQAGMEKSIADGTAKPFYEKVIELATDTTKYKRDLAEAYKYLGFHYYQKNDKVNSKANFTKMQEFDPNDKDAKEALKNLK